MNAVLDHNAFNEYATAEIQTCMNSCSSTHRHETTLITLFSA